MAKQKVVVKVFMNDSKKSRLSIFGGGNLDARAKAMTIAVGVPGVDSASIQGPDKDQLVVTGEGIDSVQLTTLLRKSMGQADLISVGPVEEKKDQKETAAAAPSVTTVNASQISSWPALPDYNGYYNSGFPLQVIDVPETSSRVGWAW